jgi:uncharacterized protein YyaL (SSP411 family)
MKNILLSVSFGIKKHVLTLLMVLCTACYLNAQTTDYQQRVKKIQSNIDKYFAAKSPYLYIETTDTAHNEKPYSYLWPICALIQAANEMEVLEPGKKYLQPVLKTIENYYNPYAPSPGYQAYVNKDGKDTRYIDDNQWIGIAAIDAYNRTKDKQYLDLAKLIYNFMMTGYDTISGGGLYWREYDFTSKNTCSNGPGVILALQLYKATKDKNYLKTGLDIFNWTNKHLLSPEGVYYDNIKMKDLAVDKHAYPYNVGTMLQSNVLLYQITKDKAYLNEASRLAVAARSYFYKNNQLPDHYWFNAVMMRGFIELYQITKDKSLIQFFADDAERIWKEERDNKDLLGHHKTKSLIDQAAMIEIYARLAYLKI